ncbi:MAG: hypothetical protein AABY32_02035 [Nanoarchaeota archaeon]
MDNDVNVLNEIEKNLLSAEYKPAINIRYAIGDKLQIFDQPNIWINIIDSSSVGCMTLNKEKDKIITSLYLASPYILIEWDVGKIENIK